MEYRSEKYIVHGGDYNPDQWLDTPEITDEDMRLMKLAHINSATVGIFSWTKLEPEEGKYDFSWLDNIMDKLHENGIGVILATPSGARPAWMAKKYPEVLRVPESGIRNEYGVRHNHCLTSPVYRRKVSEINRKLAERYGNHPALKMWHISNEYSGECHCELCQQAFREWLKKEYGNDLDELNRKWWNGFWSHGYSDWSEINSPKDRGENHSVAMKMCWDRFVTDSHISFYENETAPLRELTPGVPVTTNLMRMYSTINYQKLAKHLDIVSWDNYPRWDETEDNTDKAVETAFCHDTFRSMKDGLPFYMMESTPSVVNWKGVNKIPRPGLQTLSSVQALAHGSDSVQYFQWRKSRGGHEKFHGAVVDHCGHENTRVFREIAHTGEILAGLKDVAGTRCKSRVAVICDWDTARAVKHFCGYNNLHRDYFEECIKWYRPFWEAGISADVISRDDDFSGYELVIAPFLYMIPDGFAERTEKYISGGGNFVMTYLSAVTDRNDLCFTGGFPAGKLKEVFGVWAEETDSIPEELSRKASFLGKDYDVDHVCDIIHLRGAAKLGEYLTDFYAGMPSASVNSYGKGKAYYAAFRNDSDFASDFCSMLIKEHGIKRDTSIKDVNGNLSVRKRGEFIFIMNFSPEAGTIIPDREYTDVITGNPVGGKTSIESGSFLVLR